MGEPHATSFWLVSSGVADERTCALCLHPSLEFHPGLFTQLQPPLLSRARATTLTVLRRLTIEASGGRKYGSLRKKWTPYVTDAVALQHRPSVVSL
jgi:hypothetical protein